MIRLFRLIVCVLVVTAVGSTSVFAARQNRHQGKNYHESYHQRLQTALKDSIHRDHALKNVITQYERKKELACAKTTLKKKKKKLRNNRCNLYANKLADAHRIHHELVQRKYLLQEELAYEAEEPESEEEDEEIIEAEEGIEEETV